MKRGENYSLARPPRIIYGDKEEQKESFYNSATAMQGGWIETSWLLGEGFLSKI